MAFLAMRHSSQTNLPAAANIGQVPANPQNTITVIVNPSPQPRVPCDSKYADYVNSSTFPKPSIKLSKVNLVVGSPLIDAATRLPYSKHTPSVKPLTSRPYARTRVADISVEAPRLSPSRPTWVMMSTQSRSPTASNPSTSLSRSLSTPSSLGRKGSSSKAAGPNSAAPPSSSSSLSESSNSGSSSVSASALA